MRKTRIIKTDDGVLFVETTGMINRDEVLLCAGFDGMPVVVNDGDTFLPAQWIASEFPEYARCINKLIDAESIHDTEVV